MTSHRATSLSARSRSSPRRRSRTVLSPSGFASERTTPSGTIDPTRTSSHTALRAGTASALLVQHLHGRLRATEQREHSFFANGILSAATTRSGGTGARLVSASSCIAPQRDCLLLLFFPHQHSKLFTIPTTSCHNSRWTDEINCQQRRRRRWSGTAWGAGRDESIIMDYE